MCELSPAGGNAASSDRQRATSMHARSGASSRGRRYQLEHFEERGPWGNAEQIAEGPVQFRPP